MLPLAITDGKGLPTSSSSRPTSSVGGGTTPVFSDPTTLYDASLGSVMAAGFVETAAPALRHRGSDNPFSSLETLLEREKRTSDENNENLFKQILL